MVQGAWGIVPAHLNELSPASVRAILPGVAYQLGNLAASRLTPLQSGYAEHHGNDFAIVLAVTMTVVALALVIVTSLGREARAGELRVG
jgi:SHS family lactate transporter-like MFS transporter